MKPIIISGTSNRPLAIQIAQKLKVSLGKVVIEKFSDGETYVNIKENVKNRVVFIIQSGSDPANEHLVECLLLIDAAKRLKAKKVIVVFPFYPYRRKERHVEKGEAISAEVVAKTIKAAGADKVIACNLHSTTIEPFFKVPLQHLRLWDIFIDHYKSIMSRKNDFAVVAPDLGSRRRSKTIAQGLEIPLILVEKYRPRHDVVEISNVVGEVKDKNVILIDDEINTAGTVIGVSKALKSLGVKDIYICSVHPVLSGDAITRLNKSPIKEILVVNTINIPPEKRIKKIRILSAAKQIAEAIKENL
jgi:ribose-phosphate pyrophosphokinase